MEHLFYTVQLSDIVEGLTGIAQRVYGNKDCWTLLYEANRAVIGENPSIVEVGQQLVVPTVSSGQLPSYLVQPWDLADGLAGIAMRLWGDRTRADWLYAINRGVIGDDPNQLKVGQRLLVVLA